jgi:hypothetical protein
MRWRISLAAMLITVLAIVAVAQAAGGAPGRTARKAVTVRPNTGSPTTHFVVRFRTPQAVGRSGGFQRSYSVSASGPTGAGCQGYAGGAVGRARKGQLVHVTLSPDGGPWCAGLFHGRVEEVGRAVCSERPGTACPLFIALLRRVGTFTFRVR